MTDLERLIRMQALDAIQREYSDPVVTAIHLAGPGSWTVEMAGTQWGVRKRLLAYVAQTPRDPDAIQVEGEVIALG